MVASADEYLLHDMKDQGVAFHGEVGPDGMVAGRLALVGGSLCGGGCLQG